MRGKRADAAEVDAVPVDLIDVVDEAEEELQIGLSAGGWGESEFAAIPGESGVALVALLAPGFVGAELLPG